MHLGPRATLYFEYCLSPLWTVRLSGCVTAARRMNSKTARPTGAGPLCSACCRKNQDFLSARCQHGL